MTRTYVAPSEKMTRYLRNLVRDRRYPSFGRTGDERLATVDAMLDTSELDKFRVMELIDQLKVAPLDQGGLRPGVYRRNGEVFVVKLNREKTRLYAKRLVQITGNRLLDATEERVKADFEYAPGALQTLRPEDQLTLEDAREYLVRYSHCMVCGRPLKDARSVLDSIGPVCRGMFKQVEPEVQLTPGTGDRLAELLAQLKGA